MITIKTLAATAAIAAVAITSADIAASAQSSLTNGPNGTQPNTLPSDNATSDRPRHAMAHRRVLRQTGTRPMSSSDRRPLTVGRVVVATPGVAPALPVVDSIGLSTVVTVPLGFGSHLASLPFRGLNTVFPATGDVTTNPLVLIGAPLQAIGDIAQLPFRIVGAPFGGITIATD